LEGLDECPEQGADAFVAGEKLDETHYTKQAQKLEVGVVFTLEE